MLSGVLASLAGTCATCSAGWGLPAPFSLAALGAQPGAMAAHKIHAEWIIRSLALVPQFSEYSNAQPIIVVIAQDSFRLVT